MSTAPRFGTRVLRLLLCQLVGEPTHVFTRQELLRIVWGQAYGTSRTLDSHVISSTV